MGDSRVYILAAILPLIAGFLIWTFINQRKWTKKKGRIRTYGTITGVEETRQMTGHGRRIYYIYEDIDGINHAGSLSNPPAKYDFHEDDRIEVVYIKDQPQKNAAMLAVRQLRMVFPIALTLTVIYLAVFVAALIGTGTAGSIRDTIVGLYRDDEGDLFNVQKAVDGVGAQTANYDSDKYIVNRAEYSISDTVRKQLEIAVIDYGSWNGESLPYYNEWTLHRLKYEFYESSTDRTGMELDAQYSYFATKKAVCSHYKKKYYQSVMSRLNTDEEISPLSETTYQTEEGSYKILTFSFTSVHNNYASLNSRAFAVIKTRQGLFTVSLEMTPLRGTDINIDNSSEGQEIILSYMQQILDDIHFYSEKEFDSITAAGSNSLKAITYQGNLGGEAYSYLPPANGTRWNTDNTTNITLDEDMGCSIYMIGPKSHTSYLGLYGAKRELGKYVSDIKWLSDEEDTIKGQDGQDVPWYAFNGTRTVAGEEVECAAAIAFFEEEGYGVEYIVWQNGTTDLTKIREYLETVVIDNYQELE